MKWISWHQPTDDYRPLKYPPTEKILAWWCTGHSINGATLVALVDVKECKDAEENVKLNWPEAEDWRFCEDKEDKAFGDRFPLEDWMVDRGCSYLSMPNDAE